jgi:hypothetical protein
MHMPAINAQARNEHCDLRISNRFLGKDVTRVDVTRVGLRTRIAACRPSCPPATPSSQRTTRYVRLNHPIQPGVGASTDRCVPPAQRIAER